MTGKQRPNEGLHAKVPPHPDTLLRAGRRLLSPNSPPGSCRNCSGRDGGPESCQQAQIQSPVIFVCLEEVARGSSLPGHHPRRTISGPTQQ